MRAGVPSLVVLSFFASGMFQEVFRTATDAVLVDVLVTDGRRPIAGLTADDFELRDNGVRQQIFAVTLADVPLSLMIAADTSASMAGEPLQRLQEAAHAAVSVLKPEDRAAILAFSHAVHLVSDWTDDRGRLATAIDSLTADGGTALNHALSYSLIHRDAAQSRGLVLVFSDGIDSASALSQLMVLDLGRRTDVVVYAVILGQAHGQPLLAQDYTSGIELIPPDGRPPLLEAITRETGGSVFRADRPADLREAFLNVVTDFKSRYVLSYSPKNVAPGGWHTVNVTLKHRRAKVIARRGYLR